MKILIDSDAFIAFYSKEDSLHEKSVKVISAISKKNYSQYTTWEVIDEVTTKLSYRFSRDTARKFLYKLLVSDIFIVYPDENLASKALEVFEQVKNEHVSLTDCFNIAVCKDKKIDCVFSFDKIYKKVGLKLLPDII